MHFIMWTIIHIMRLFDVGLDLIGPFRRPKWVIRFGEQSTLQVIYIVFGVLDYC